MQRPTVAIGITTYRDLRGKDIALDVLRALTETNVRLLPQFVNWHEPVNVALDSNDTWIRFWELNALWRRRHSVQSGGTIWHRSDPTGDTTLSLDFRWDRSVDWWGLFGKLCEISCPAYGMVHLFTAEERKTLDYQVFDGPVVGEFAFTCRVAADGNFVRPDSWDMAARRSYRFLPELSWGNYFGPEFGGRYDRAELGWHVLHEPVIPEAAMFRLTSEIGDVIDGPQAFGLTRSRARTAFAEGTFRRPLEP